MFHRSQTLSGRSVVHRAKCSVCSRPGVATLHINNPNDAKLEAFWPTARPKAELPEGVPVGEFENSASPYGTCDHVGKQHLHRYCDEFQFRWNTRRMTDGERTMLALKISDGKRLQYRTGA